MVAPAAAVTQAENGLFSFLDQCHQAILRKLELMRSTAEALEANGPTPLVRSQARELVDWFNAEARQHHLDEEKHIFPPLLASNDEAILQTTHQLMQDHGWLEADWVEIEPSLSAAADGNNWFDPAELRHAVEVFHQLYLDHIVLEELHAYPQARERMNPALLDAMGVEMARRRAVRDARGSSV